jgi:hypothetical protein
MLPDNAFQHVYGSVLSREQFQANGLTRQQ